MFKRENLPKTKENKSKNEKNRVRNVIVNFRATPEEKEKIERRIELSGLSRQDFFIQSLMNQKVICIGNVKSFDVMKKRLDEIEQCLKDISVVNSFDENILESMRMMLELFNGLNQPID